MARKEGKEEAFGRAENILVSWSVVQDDFFFRRAGKRGWREFLLLLLAPVACCRAVWSPWQRMVSGEKRDRCQILDAVGGVEGEMPAWRR